MIGAILAEIWPYLAALGTAATGVLALWLGGRKSAKTAAKLNEAERYRETRERMDDAPDFTDRPDAASDWLRERQRSSNLRRD